MKTTKTITLSLFVILSFVFNSNAQDINYKELKNYAVIEFNYLKGLESPIDGVRLTSAYYLGEMHSKNAVNALIDMLHNDACQPSPSTSRGSTGRASRPPSSPTRATAWSASARWASATPPPRARCARCCAEPESRHSAARRFLGS